MVDTPMRAPTNTRVKRIALHIGAEIDGIDISSPLDEETVDELRSALLTHKVIFFRNQDLDHEQHIAFARQFGELVRRPVRGDATQDRFREIVTISTRADLERYGFNHEAHYRARWRTYTVGWHSDGSRAINPPAAAVLRAETLPPFGGDTQWTNMVAAYEGLPEPLRRLVDGLRAEHSFFAGLQMVDHHPRDRQMLASISENPMTSVHPVVRVHPETGERALFVTPSRTDRIVGFTPTESRHILDLLFDHMLRPEYLVRFTWAAGSVAFWDNRATAHLAPSDYGDAERVMHRVTLAGDRPVGPDGFRSETVSGRRYGRA